MNKFKKYDMTGHVTEEFEIDKSLLEKSVNEQMVKDYLVAIRANRRQWSANTKGRSEINHSNKKPHPQKGTGRARQGTIKAAQYRGGAAVFGPKPKFNQHVRINQKERRSAIRFLLAGKIKEGHLHVLKEAGLKTPKTKTAAVLFKQIGIGGKKILFLGQSFEKRADDEIYFYLSMRNLPKMHFMAIENISGYDVMNCQEIVISENALDKLLKILGDR